jgi:AraC-like DNA-binding protein
MYGFRQFIVDRGKDGEVIDLYLGNPKVKISEIAQQFGRSEAEIYRILHAHDISPNRLGINHQKVQNLSRLGWGIQEIAKFTGYTPRNVRYILAKNITEGKK